MRGPRGGHEVPTLEPERNCTAEKLTLALTAIYPIYATIPTKQVNVLSAFSKAGFTRDVRSRLSEDKRELLLLGELPERD